VSWPNLAKIGRCEVAEKSSRIVYKKLRRRGHFWAPISPPLSRSSPKFRDLCMCTDFGPDRLRFAGLIPEGVQNSQYNRLKAATLSLQIWRKTIFNMADRMLIPCNVVRGPGIITMNSPSGSRPIPCKLTRGSGIACH